MPYDAFGNFTRSYNFTADKVAGLKIQSVRVDGECDNFTTAFNQVMLRNGVAPMSGTLKLGNNTIIGIAAGSAPTPSVSFNGDLTTGVYSPSAGVVALSAVGVEIVRAAAASFQIASTAMLSFTGSLTTGISTPGADILGFRVSGAEIARISATGLLMTGLLTVSVGIKFPATQAASTDVNNLDDYEEGTWTPTLKGDTSPFASGQAYSVQLGQYQKIGRKVKCWGQITLTTKGTLSGTFVGIFGFPFIADNTNLNAIGTLVSSAGLASCVYTSLYLPFFSVFAYITIKKIAGTTAPSAVLADVSNGFQCDFELEYMAAQ